MRSYQDSFELAKRTAAAVDDGKGMGAKFVTCAWGNPLGIDFGGLSLPADPQGDEWRREREREDFARWAWLVADPLCELEKLTIRDPSAAAAEPPPGVDPDWLVEWNRITAYRPSAEMALLLARTGIDDAAWDRAWHAVMAADPIAKTAFEHSPGELSEAAQALGRAVVARLHRELADAGLPVPARGPRDRMVIQLHTDWQVLTLAPDNFFVKGLKRLATGLLKRYRAGVSDAIAPFIGDILLYQSHGEQIRDYIARVIGAAPAPVTVVAHSLGGIACVDLLAMPGAPGVHRLVTVGSQAPLLYEIGALTSLRTGQTLPAHFPRWLNVFDRADMLSYVASPLFGSPDAPERVHDLEIDSGKPFPDAHSAYFGDDEVWSAVHRFMQP